MIQFHLVEGGVIELTVFETDRQSQLVALVKAESQHLTIFKFCFLKGTFYHLHIAQIAAVKRAVQKADSRKVCRCKIAVPEIAVIILTCRQRGFRIILFGKQLLYYVFLVHMNKDNQNLSGVNIFKALCQNLVQEE